MLLQLLTFIITIISPAVSNDYEYEDDGNEADEIDSDDGSDVYREDILDNEGLFCGDEDGLINNDAADEDQSIVSSSSSSISSVSIEDDDKLVVANKNNQQGIINKQQQHLVSKSVAEAQHQQPTNIKRTATTEPTSSTRRSEKLQGFEKCMFDDMAYITQESIAKAILRPCCVEECLRKKLNSAAGYSCLNFESVYTKILEARKQLVGNDLKDKVLILKTIIQGNFVRSINYTTV